MIAAATAVVGGVCVWQVVRNTPNENASSPVETFPETSLQPAEPEQTPIADTSIAENVSAPVETRHGTSLHQTQDAAPVVITREIPVTRTVVLHDTITVTDTIFLMQHHD